MVVLPLFWDQHDNAQRMQELGLGRRLDTYGHEPKELIEAVDGLLADPRLPGRLSGISQRLQAEPGTVKAVDLIESLVAAGPLSAGRSLRRSGRTRAPRAAS